MTSLEKMFPNRILGELQALGPVTDFWNGHFYLLYILHSKCQLEPHPGQQALLRNASSTFSLQSHLVRIS